MTNNENKVNSYSSGSREIRFRAYHKKFNTMYEVLRLGIKGYKTLCSGTSYEDIAEFSNNDIVIMQYTLLKDSKGLEIYEGDILEFPQEESVILIRRDITGANRQFDVLSLQFDDGHGRGNRDFTMGIAKSCIVLGNIYENTELLSE